jgi:hypothetical protein
MYPTSIQLTVVHPRPIGRRLAAVFGAILLLSSRESRVSAQAQAAQTASPSSTEQKVERLTAAVAQVEAQMLANQKQLEELRQELAALQVQMAAEKNSAATPAQPLAADASTVPAPPATLEEIRERQEMQESQIATHEVTKVETQSKYPLKLSGLLLFNGFVNTRQVDVSVAPSYAVPGSGNTGLSLRQTVLGFDARGPRVFGATSHGDLRVDFFAGSNQSNYAASGILRLRTAHVDLDWQHTQAFVELDRSILEPNEPTSLLAVALPELAWAGNLWNWSPQVGVSHDFAISDTSSFKVQAALIDTFDPRPPGSTPTATVTQTESSRWPGTEARLAFERGTKDGKAALGAGGYFSPHRTGVGDAFNAWAGTVDLHLPVTRHFDFTANAYRGQSLDGLGAGGYINYYYLYSYGYPTPHALDDVGGWTQLKARAGQRVEFNTGIGADNPFAKEVKAAAAYMADLSPGATYSGLARNRAVYSNVIWSPNAYLQFSLEYKRLWTNYASGPTAFSDSIGLGAGYKF